MTELDGFCKRMIEDHGGSVQKALITFTRLVHEKHPETAIIHEKYGMTRLESALQRAAKEFRRT
ncbi:MAG: hypothetical protein ACHQRJ_12910 [Alphaproteobacteria bacterium]